MSHAFARALPNDCIASGTGARPLRNTIALDRLAELPDHLAELLVRDDTVRSIHIGTGGVPDLDDMSALRGVPVRNSRSDLWDNRAGAFRDGRLLVGDLPAATVDLMAHELGHAISIADNMASSTPTSGTRTAPHSPPPRSGTPRRVLR